MHDRDLLEGHALPQTSINHARLVALIWGIADDVLRDLYVRGKYRDVILPFTVLLSASTVCSNPREAVMAMKKTLDSAGITNQDGPLRDAAKQDFYNTSGFTLRDLRSVANATRLRQNFEGLPRWVLAERSKSSTTLSSATSSPTSPRPMLSAR